MLYIKQFGIILLFSLIGELLHFIIPLPIPASIYGIILLFSALMLGIIKLDHVEQTGSFLIEIMPLMFIPAAVGIMESLSLVKASLWEYIAITAVSTIIVMAVSGFITQLVIKYWMIDFTKDSVFFGLMLSLGAYGIGILLKRKLKLAIFNPLLVAAVLIVAFLSVAKIDYETFNNGAKYISYLLTPATVALAIPLYRQFHLLKKNAAALMIGIASGVLSSFLSIMAIAILFQFSHEEYVTFLPKSITTAIGMGISEELGGYVSITAASIIVTGILGNIIAEFVFRLFKIHEPIAKGIALGSSSHAIGTAKAMELGETEGAMSSLAIILSGILTVLGVMIFANII